MKIEEYLTTRLEDQINWYDSKAVHCHKWHDRLSIGSIIGTSTSAFLAAISSSFPNYSTGISIIASFVAFITTVILGIDKLKKYQELHLQYRSTCEKLKQEKYLFITKSGEYKQTNDPTYDQLFVERCESIMSTETGNWSQLIEKKS